jgi:SAM-dependent methyltransferase
MRREPNHFLAVSSHYLGVSGARYFAYQSQFADFAGKYIAAKFAAQIKPSDVVLDFGCGGGFVLLEIACADRIGVEINPAARLVAERLGITCCESLDEVANEGVDVVIAHHSLEHVLGPLATLRSLLLKLKPGGLLLVSLPIDDWRCQQKYDPNEINHHLYTWTPLLLGHLFYEAGFDTGTFSSRIGINGWFRAFPLCFKLLPRPCAEILLTMWCFLRKTREITASVRKPPCEC